MSVGVIGAHSIPIKPQQPPQQLQPQHVGQGHAGASGATEAAAAKAKEASPPANGNLGRHFSAVV